MPKPIKQALGQAASPSHNTVEHSISETAHQSRYVNIRCALHAGLFTKNRRLGTDKGSENDPDALRYVHPSSARCL